MPLKVKRLSFGLGAEISGLDFDRPISRDVVGEIFAAWYEHQILVFPNADLSLEGLVDFGKRFGELELHPLKALRHPIHPEVIEITNKRTEGRPSETGEIGRAWHSDGVFTLRPPTGSLLHCRAIPDAGGTTWFSNTYMAYDTLSDGMKRFLDGHEVVNDVFKEGQSKSRVLAAAKPISGAASPIPPVIQPMVRVHPETGRKAIYVNVAVTRRILSMTAEESAGILTYLFEHSIKPEFVYCHRWRVNDLVMWDNRCTMHLAPGDYSSDQLRQMYRVTLAGEPQGRPYYEQEQLEAGVA